MSLGLIFKGAEGIVLAADSRVTLTTMVPGQPIAVPSTFDNATKLLRVAGLRHVGAVTYGLGALGQKSPRTAHSFIPEFEEELQKDFPADEDKKALTTKEFAKRLSAFFVKQWQQQGMPPQPPPGSEMIFLVGGYDPGEPMEVFLSFTFRRSRHLRNGMLARVNLALSGAANENF